MAIEQSQVRDDAPHADVKDRQVKRGRCHGNLIYRAG